jgi:hypothetical protein
LVIAENTRLLQQAVYQCGFAMIDMRDDGDIPKVGTFSKHNDSGFLSFFSAEGRCPKPLRSQ